MDDISSLGIVSASEVGAEMVLLNPFTGEPTSAKLMVLGFDAPAVVAAGREFDRSEGRRAAPTEGDDPMQRRRVVLTLAAVTGWAGFGWKGKEPDFSTKLLGEILADPNYSFIAEQVYRFGASRRNFTPGGAKGS